MKRAVTTITGQQLADALRLRPWITVARVFQREDNILNDSFQLLLIGEGLPGEHERNECENAQPVDLADLIENGIERTR